MKVSSIVGYEGKYDITSDGDIISLNYNNTGKQQKLKYRLNKKGRPYINLCINGKYKSYEIHRLVAEAFIPKIEGKEQVNHIDGNKQNNSIKNLEWVTRDENMQHASINGLLPTEFRNAKCKLSNKQVEEIRKKYKPFIYTNKMLSEEYGVSITHIKSIIKGRKRIICEKPSGNLDS